jgi:hypothetical protein
MDDKGLMRSAFHQAILRGSPPRSATFARTSSAVDRFLDSLLNQVL